MPEARAPRRRISPHFRVAVYRSGVRIRDLADRAGFASQGHLSSLLGDEHVRETPLIVSRLRLVASLINFDQGAIFTPEVIAEPVRMNRDQFDAEHLPAPVGRAR